MFNKYQEITDDAARVSGKLRKALSGEKIGSVLLAFTWEAAKILADFESPKDAEKQFLDTLKIAIMYYQKEKEAKE